MSPIYSVSTSLLVCMGKNFISILVAFCLLFIHLFVLFDSNFF